MINFKRTLVYIAVLFLLTTCSKDEVQRFSLQVRITPSEGGTASPLTGKYDDGEEISVSALPEDGYDFYRWSGDMSGTANPMRFRIISDMEITAEFIKEDLDGDGVANEQDNCPNTQPGTEVDENGCPIPTDTDGDGVADDIDECPNTPSGDDVNEQGCTIPPTDTDGDGISDDNDQCANTPDGETVDSQGCSDSQKDADDDGVTDDVDECPDTPQGESVDENGCPLDTSGNLLQNGSADQATQYWTVYGNSGVEPYSGNNVFYTRDITNTPSYLLQDVFISTSSSGKYLLLIGNLWVENVVSGSITRHPYLYGYQMIGNTDISVYMQGQDMGHDADAGVWQVRSGIFEIAPNVDTIRFFLNQASQAGDDPDGTKALFDDIELRIFDSREEAIYYRDYIYDPVLKNTDNTDLDGDGITNENDQCPNDAGPAENNGCPWPDSDGDGLIDNVDECPNQSGPAENNGCPFTDSDGDGINDDTDQCPIQAGPAENNGCPWPDSDGDGLTDNVDECPNQSGPAENNGCPFTDSDGDGVTDDVDQCPNTPQGENVDETGCSQCQIDNTGPVISTNIRLTDRTTNSFTIEWSLDEEGLSYLLYGTTGGDLDGSPINNIYKLEHVQTVGGLDSDTAYFFQIYAEDRCGNSSVSAISMVSTLGDEDSDNDGVPDNVDQCPNEAGPAENNGCPVNRPPNTPANPYPTNGEVIWADYPPYISWSATDPDGDPLTYDVYFGTTVNPPLVSSDQSVNEYDVGGWSAGRYYWRVVAKDNQGNSTEGPLWYFDVNVENYPPSTPANPYPTNGEVIWADYPPYISWSTTDPDGDPLTYDVYFGTTVNPPLVSSDQSVNEYDVGGWSAGRYYWRVVAKDNQGNSTEGPLWYFDVNVENYPPSTPANPYPANGDTIWSDFPPYISWSAIDPDGDPLTYDVYFGTTVNPPLVSSDQSVNEYDVGGWSVGRYYWRVVAKDNQGNSTEGPLWYFDVNQGF